MQERNFFVKYKRSFYKLARMLPDQRRKVMKVCWLGQAGLLFQTGKTTIMVDPYLSNSAAKINPRSFRRVPLDERIFDIHPDILIFTHCHIDHYDPETAERFLLSEKPITVLCPSSVWSNVRKYGNGHNYVEFNAGTEWSTC